MRVLFLIAALLLVNTLSADCGLTVSITPPATFCAGTALSFSSAVSGGSGNYTYRWTGGMGAADTEINGSLPGVVLNFDVAQTYTVVCAAVDTDGCIGVSEILSFTVTGCH